MVAIVAVVAALIVVTGSLAAYAAYLGTVGSIHHINVTNLGKPPPSYNSAENILIIGAYSSLQDYVTKSTSTSSDIGADTYVLVHIEPNHKGAIMLSFPRDSEVPIINCPAVSVYQGQQASSGVEPLNQTYSLGGPGCAMNTIEHVSGIYINHFIEINYLGFEKFVQAIGGAEVCLPYAVNVPYDGLRLSAGMHHIGPATALKFVRARYLGTGSDLQRIQRQQFFMIAVMQSAIQKGMLGNPLKLYSVAHAVAPYLTTDSGFNIAAMYDLARSMEGVSLSKVQLLQVPTVPYPPDTNRVEFETPQANSLFAAIAQNKKVPKATSTPSATSSASASAKPTPAPSVKPSQVQVDVLNGNGVPGGASQADTDLTNAGFGIAGTGDANNYSYTSSVVEYGPSSDLAAATLVEHYVPGATVQQVSGLSAGTVTLIVGSTFNGVKTPTAAATPKATPSVSHLSKTYNGETGTTNICKDQSAFAG